MGKAGVGEEEGKMDSDETGNTVLGGGEEPGAPGKPPPESWDCERDDGHPQEDTKEAACRKAGSQNHCHCRRVDFLIGSHPRVGKYALIQRINRLDDTTGGILEDHNL